MSGTLKIRTELLSRTGWRWGRIVIMSVRWKYFERTRSVKSNPRTVLMTVEKATNLQARKGRVFVYEALQMLWKQCNAWLVLVKFLEAQLWKVRPF